MTWLAVLNGLLSLATAVMKVVGDRQLMDAGEAKSVAKGLQEAMDAIDRARRARAAVKHDADSVRNDPANRDNQ